MTQPIAIHRQGSDVALPLSIRPMEPQDAPFVMSSFLKSFRGEGSNASMSNELYFRMCKPLAERLVSGPDVLVITPTEDTWQILAWIASYGRNLEYAYTKSTYRRMSMFDRLFEAAGRPTIIKRTGRLIVPLAARYHFTF